MKIIQKLKISKILATSILAGSSIISNNAFAVNETITYTGAGYRLSSGALYANLSDLDDALEPRITAGDVFTFVPGSLQNFLGDLFTKDAARNEFLTVYNDANPDDKITKDELIAAGVSLEDLILVEDPTIKQYISDLEKQNYQSVAQTIGSTVHGAVSEFRLESQAKNALTATDTREGDVLNANPDLKARFDQLKDLQAQLIAGNASLKTQIEELTQQLVATQKFIEFRNSATTQEELKVTLKAIQENLNSNNKLVKASALELLSDLKNTQLSYLANPSRVAASDLPQVQKPDTQATGAMLNSSLTTNTVLSERISGFSGIAAGDDSMPTYGVWAKAIYSKGEQKPLKADLGYDFSQMGVSIGVDNGGSASDNGTLIGVAYSFSKNEVKSKNNSATKDDIDTHVGSIYGMYSASSQMFISGQASYGFSKISKKRATGDLANNIATAKPDGNSLFGKAEVGYAVQVIEAVSVVPTLGLSYSNVEVKGYTEKGNGLNRKVAKRKAQRASALGGASVKYLAELNDMKIVPELHVNFDYAFKSKNSATTVTLVEGLAPIATPSEKISKLYYSVGTSAKVIASDAIDVSAGYDLGLSKKFMSHTAMLKLRVKF